MAQPSPNSVAYTLSRKRSLNQLREEKPTVNGAGKPNISRKTHAVHSSSISSVESGSCVPSVAPSQRTHVAAKRTRQEYEHDGDTEEDSDSNDEAPSRPPHQRQEVPRKTGLIAHSVAVADSTSGTSISGVKPYEDHGRVTHEELNQRYPVYEKCPFVRHTCSENCRFAESMDGLKQYRKVVHSPLMLPLLFGWNREIRCTRMGSKIAYSGPCGLSCPSFKTLDDYLRKTKSVLPLSCFTFELNIDLTRRLVIPPTKIQAFVPDIAEGTIMPFIIPAVNCYAKSLPTRLIYITKQMKSQDVARLIESGEIPERKEGCACEGICTLDCLCSNMDRNMADEAVPGYNYGRVLESAKFVVECTGTCKCDRFCRKRVTTVSIPWNVVLYFYPDKGWGVRAMCDIPQGAFMGLYLGQLLTEDDLEKDRPSDTFLFTLYNLNEASPANQLNTSQTSTSQDTLNYEKLVNIDSHKYGNYTRYFNHSCDPNMFVQVILREHIGPLLYSVGFFTKRNIVAGEELTWNYNYKVGSVENRRIDCVCGAETCRGRLL